jgi:hypothetical protein
MLNIPKQIVTNEARQPVAIQIDYASWLKLEKLLQNLLVTSRETPFQPTSHNLTEAFYWFTQLPADGFEEPRRDSFPEEREAL